MLDSEHIRKLKLCLASLEGSRVVLSDTFVRLYQGGNLRPDVFVQTRDQAKKAAEENKDPKKNPKKKNPSNSDGASVPKTKTYFTSVDLSILQKFPKDNSPYDKKRAVKNYDTSLLFRLLRFTSDLKEGDPLYEKCREVKEIRNNIHNFHEIRIEDDAELKIRMEDILKSYKETYELLGSRCDEDMSAYIKNIKKYVKDLIVSPPPSEDWKVYEACMAYKGKEELVEDRYNDMRFQPTNDIDMSFPVKEVYTPLILSEEDTDSDAPTHSFPADHLLESSYLWGDGKVLLVGKPGSGKTAFNQHLMSMWCDHNSDPEDSKKVLDQISLMFYVDLSWISEGETLTTLISQWLMPKTCLQIPSEKIIQTLQKSGSKVVWLFDSFDEAIPKVRKNLVSEVCRKFEYVIVTCRPDFIQTVKCITKMVKWKVLGLTEMNDSSVKELTNKVFKILKSPTDSINEFNRFIEVRSKSFISLKSSPLHLTLLCWLWSKADHKKTDLKKIATTCSLYVGILFVIRDQLAEKLIKITGSQRNTISTKYIEPWMTTLCAVAFHSFVTGTKKLNAEGIRRLKHLCKGNDEVEELIFSTMLHSKKRSTGSLTENDYVCFLCHGEMLEFLAAEFVHKRLKHGKALKDIIRHNHDKATNVLTHLAALVVDSRNSDCDSIITGIMNILSNVWDKKKMENETHSRNFNPWLYFINETKSYPKAIEYLTRTFRYFPITDIDLQQFHDVLQYVIPNLLESEVRVMLYGDTCDCPALEKTLESLKRKNVTVSLDLYKSFREDANTIDAEHREAGADDNHVELMLGRNMCSLVRVSAHLSQNVISDLHYAKLEILQLQVTHVSHLEALKSVMNNLNLKILSLHISIPKDCYEPIPRVAQKKNNLTFTLVLNDVRDKDIGWCARIASRLYSGQYLEIRIKGVLSPEVNMTMYAYLKKSGIQFKDYKPPKMLLMNKHSVGSSNDRTDHSLYVARLDPKTDEDQLHQRILQSGIEPIKVIKLITPIDEFAAAFRVELKNKYECFAIKMELADKAYTAFWYSEENEFLNKEMASNTRGYRSRTRTGRFIF